MTLPCRNPGMLAAQGMVALTFASVCVWLYTTLVGSRSAAGFEWVNHDVANILYVGRAMLDGQRLYVDIVELNPPAIFLLGELIVVLAQTLGVSPVHTYHCLAIALATLGTWVIQDVYTSTLRPRAMILVCLAFMLILLGVGLPGVRELTYSFGQREHLFALSFIPYLIWRLEDGRHGRAAYAMLFGLGYLASMKPHFVVLVVAVELFCWIDRRVRTWPVWGTVAAGALLPLLLLLVHSPKSLAALWTETVRLHLAGAYRYFNQPYSVFVSSPQHDWLLGHAVALAYFLWPLQTGRRAPRLVRLSVTGLPLLAYLLVVEQHKFWSYHAVVVVSLATVLTYYLLSQLLPRLPKDRATALHCLATAALMAQLGVAAATFDTMIREWKRGTGESADVLRLAPVLQGRHRVLYYSTSIVHMQLALFLGQRIVGRWCHDVLYPSLVRHPDPERRSELLEAYCAEQKALIRALRPEAVVFDSARQGLEASDPDLFDVLVGRCEVVPERFYFRGPEATASRAAVFLRR